MARVLLGFLLFSSVFLGQPLVLRIRVLEGDGAVRTPGSRGNLLMLEVADELGRPVPQATVGLQLPDDGPSGTFASGLRTEIALTDAQGRASVRGLRVNSLAGPFDIRITAAKQGSRAGMLSRQYIAAAGGRGKAPAAASKSSRKRWITIAGFVAGAVVVGVAAGGGGSTATVSPGSPPGAPPTATTIGAPSEISIGAP